MADEKSDGNEEDGGEAIDLDEYMASGAFEEDDPSRHFLNNF